MSSADLDIWLKYFVFNIHMNQLNKNYVVFTFINLYSIKVYKLWTHTRKSNRTPPYFNSTYFVAWKKLSVKIKLINNELFCQSLVCFFSCIKEMLNNEAIKKLFFEISSVLSWIIYQSESRVQLLFSCCFLLAMTTH